MISRDCDNLTVSAVIFIVILERNRDKFHQRPRIITNINVRRVSIQSLIFEGRIWVDADSSELAKFCPRDGHGHALELKVISRICKRKRSFEISYLRG